MSGWVSKLIDKPGTSRKADHRLRDGLTTVTACAGTRVLCRTEHAAGRSLFHSPMSLKACPGRTKGFQFCWAGVGKGGPAGWPSVESRPPIPTMGQFQACPRVQWLSGTYDTDGFHLVRARRRTVPPDSCRPSAELRPGISGSRLRQQGVRN